MEFGLFWREAVELVNLQSGGYCGGGEIRSLEPHLWEVKLEEASEFG